MNPDLDRLHSYSFQKLNALLEGVKPDSGRSVVPLHRIRAFAESL